MQDDEQSGTPDAELGRALDAWTAMAPPADFVDRVLTAREAIDPPRVRPRRVRLIGGIVIAGAAAGLAIALLRSPRAPASGALVATRRTTQTLGMRGIAVAEPASELTWRVDERGAAEIVQRTGNVFYRVERGGAFVVHTPAGDVRVTGTCFRIEVTPMNTNQKMLLSGVAGAAVASAVLVTVYEGHVIAETRSARTELAAGGQATLGRAGDVTVGGGAALPPEVATPTDDAHATREQLLARMQQQQAQLVKLRARLAELDKPPGESALDVAEPGRPWHDPSPEKLASWVAECRIRGDEPSLNQFSPLTEPNPQLGLTADELDGYNAAMTEMAKHWKDTVRGLYLEVTGDTAGGDALSLEAMQREIEDKSPRGEYNLVLQRMARERAGLATPPIELTRASAIERFMRAYLQLGDQSEAALAKRLGADRAHAIRGDGWSSRHELAGCPGEPGR